MHQFCNYVYAWLYDRVKREDLEKFEYELNSPLPGSKASEKVSDEMIEAENDAFFALAGLATQHGDV